MKFGRNFAKMVAVKDIKLSRDDVKFDGKYWELWGIRLFGSDMKRVLDLVIQSVTKRDKKPFWIATVNTEFVMKALEDKGFFEILQKTDLNVMDGIGLIWAHMMKENKGWHKEYLVPGVELMERMCEEAGAKKMSVYFFGGWGDRAKRTAELMKNKYPEMVVAGYAEEDFDFETKADFLFVARGMKKQEEWIEKNLDKLQVGVVMGVGGSFDFFAGSLKRAPQWMRRMGLEWLYRLIQEPKRWRRQLALPRFVWKVIFG